VLIFPIWTIQNVKKGQKQCRSHLFSLFQLYGVKQSGWWPCEAWSYPG
jgi:hypothetical protein